MTEAAGNNSIDPANASSDDAVRRMHSTEGAADSTTVDEEFQGVATSDVDIDHSKSTNESPVNSEEDCNSPVHSDGEILSPAPSGIAQFATALDDGENAEKLIILPNFTGDPIILPVKSKQKPKQKIAEPIQDSVVVGEMLAEELVQKVSDKEVAKMDEKLVRKAALMDDVSDNRETYTTSLSQSHKSVDINVEDPMDVKENAPIVTDSAVSKDNGDGEDGPRNIKLVDYASKLAGAQILEQSPTLKGSSNLLTGDKDKYSIAPCMDKKYIVIGLSEDILVKQIILSNYERYSSRVREFQVLASQEYPTPSDDYWNSIGTYEAHSKSGEQAFELLEPTWARYLKIRFLSHYGSEHYCTLSQIKVHGSTMLQGFHEQWIESEKKDWDFGQEDSAIVEGGEESEAKLVGEEGEMDIEGSIEEDTEVAGKILNDSFVGDGESVPVKDSSIEVTQNNREPDAEDSPTVAIDNEVQNKVVSKTTVVGERSDEEKGDDLLEIMEYSMQEVANEESSIVGEEVDIDQLPCEIEMDVKNLVEAVAAEHRLIDEEEVQAQIAEPYTNNEILEEDSTTISDNTEHEKLASNLLGLNLERENIIAKSTEDTMQNDPVINLSLDDIKSFTGVSDVEVLDSIRTNVTSAMSSIESSDRDEEGEADKNPSDIKMEEEPLLETPMKQMSDTISSQATDETAKDESDPKNEGDAAMINRANNGIKLEKGIPNSKDDDSKAAAGRGLLQHDILSDTDKDDKERRGIEKSTGKLYAKLSHRFPHASCLQDLEFQAFKSRTLPVHTGSAGSAGGGAKMEPIFTKITSEIKSVQITQHQYEQFISALKACYDVMFLDMVKDLDSIQESFEKRLSYLEREDFVSVMRSNDHLTSSSFDRSSVFVSTVTSMMHSFGRSSVFASTFTSIMHQVVSAPITQERSDVLCAASVAICLLLLWRTVRRNNFRSPGEKIIRDNGYKANGKATSAKLTSHLSYNSSPQKNDRDCTTRHFCQIPEVPAQDNDFPPELIAENQLVRALIAENNLLKKEAARRLNFPGRSEPVHNSSSSAMSSLRPPFRLSHIDHVVIRCRNFPVMFDFYHRILGCSIDEPIDNHVGRFGGALTHLRAGSCYIDLLSYDTKHLTDEGCEAVARMHSGGAGLDDGDGIDNLNFSHETSTLDHLCLRIHPFDRDRLLDYFEILNVNIVKRVTAGDTRLGADGVSPSLYLHDPEGNVIELKGRPSGNTAKSIIDEVSLMP